MTAAGRLFCGAVLAALLVAPSVAAASEAAPSEAADPAAETADAPADPCADLRVWEKPACEVSQGVQAGVDGVVASGVASVFDQLYEWVASGAAWLLEQLVTLIDSSSRPDVTAGWFGRQYGVMASLAVALVMPLLLIASAVAVVRRDWNGLLRSYFAYLPAAMLGTALAVPLVDMAIAITDGMSNVFLGGMRGEINAFTDTVTDALGVAAAPTAAAGGGGAAPFLMFLGAALIAIGAFAVWVELVLRTAGIYVALFFLPLGFAALVWPATRRWFGRLVKALAALIISKFVIVAVIALAASALGSIGQPTGTEAVSSFSGVIAGSALMLMAAFSPLVLFRLADVAGDEMASAFGGLTQHRTSPVPTPSPQQSAAKVYSRIISSRSAGTGAGTGAGRGATTASPVTAGSVAATGGAAAVVAGAGALATMPARVGQRIDEGAAGQSGGQPTPTTGSSPAGPTDERSPRPATSAPTAKPATGPAPAASHVSPSVPQQRTERRPVEMLPQQDAPKAKE